MKNKEEIEKMIENASLQIKDIDEKIKLTIDFNDLSKLILLKAQMMAHRAALLMVIK